MVENNHHNERPDALRYLQLALEILDTDGDHLAGAHVAQAINVLARRRSPPGFSGGSASN